MVNHVSDAPMLVLVDCSVNLAKLIHNNAHLVVLIQELFVFSFTHQHYFFVLSLEAVVKKQHADFYFGMIEEN
jgi:hypothetical protein